MILVGVIADHEGVAADVREAIAFVEATGAMIVDVHRQEQLARAAVPK